MNEHYKTPTVLERVDHKTYKLKQNFEYDNGEIQIKIKRYFHTDGASIPKPAWALVGCPFTGKYVGPAIVHDALCDSLAIPREDTDNLFREMMKEAGVGIIKRNVMYFFVRAKYKIMYDILKKPHITSQEDLVQVKLYDD